MMKKYILIILLAIIFKNNVNAQLACPIDSCANFSNYFINTGPAITSNQGAINAGFYYTIKQDQIVGADTTVCYAFVQPAGTDWSKLQLFVSYPSCAGNATNYTGYGNGASSYANGNWNSSVNVSTSGGLTCVKGSLTGNPDPGTPNELTTLGTFQYPNCNKVASTLNAGNNNCSLVIGQTYKHCFKIIKSTSCPGDLIISPIITCTNNCVPAGKACKPIEYLSTVKNSTCKGNNTDGAIDLTVCGNKKLTFLWNDLNTTEDRLNLAPGNYNVTITDTESSSCDTIVNFTVTPESCKEPPLDSILIPNVITPNGDLDNQYFYISGLEFYPDSRLEIYDRWGLKMYENSNYQNDWDGGNYKTGKPVTSGVYYYILYQSDEKKTTYHGFVQVLK